jgi:hypothetical protein
MNIIHFYFFKSLTSKISDGWFQNLSSLKSRKSIILCLFLILFQNATLSQYKFTKVLKYEEGMVKDNQGNETDDSFRKFYFPDGKTSTVVDYNPEILQGKTILYKGLNLSKNAFILIYNDKPSSYEGNYGRVTYYGELHIESIYFYKGSTDKNWSSSAITGFDNLIEKNIDSGVNSRYAKFPISNGWSFSRVEGDHIILARNGTEYKFLLTKTADGYGMFYKWIK